MSVQFTPAGVNLIVECNLRYPERGATFTDGEIRRRLYRAAAGLRAGSSLRIAVSERTPLTSLEVPDGIRLELCAPSEAVARVWLARISWRAS